MGKVINFRNGGDEEDVLKEFLDLAKGGGSSSSYDELCPKLLRYVQERLKKSRNRIEEIKQRSKRLSRQSWKVLGYIVLGILICYLTFYLNLWNWLFDHIPIPNNYTFFIKLIPILLLIGFISVAELLGERMTYSEQEQKAKWEQALKVEAHLWKNEISQIRLIALHCPSHIEGKILELLQHWEKLADQVLEE